MDSSGPETDDSRSEISEDSQVSPEEPISDSAKLREAFQNVRSLYNVETMTQFSNAKTPSAKSDSDYMEPVYQKTTQLFCGWTKQPISQGRSAKAPNGVVKTHPGQRCHGRCLPRTRDHLRRPLVNKNRGRIQHRNDLNPNLKPARQSMHKQTIPTPPTWKSKETTPIQGPATRLVRSTNGAGTLV